MCALLRHGGTAMLADFLDCAKHLSPVVHVSVTPVILAYTSGLLAQTSVISLFALCSLVAEIVGRARLHRLSRFVRIAGATASLYNIYNTMRRQKTGHWYLTTRRCEMHRIKKPIFEILKKNLRSFSRRDVGTIAHITIV